MSARSAISKVARTWTATQRWMPSCIGCQIRNYATPAASTTPAPSSASSAPSTSTSTSPKINQIVDQIAGLTLLEASELVSAMKTRLNIADIAVAAPVAAAPAAGGAGGAGAAAAEAEPEKPKEKTTFTATLTKIDSAQKAKVIKEVKNLIPTMNLVEGKKFVENLPQTLKENVTKDDIEKLKKAFEAVGAAVEIS